MQTGNEQGVFLIVHVKVREEGIQNLNLHFFNYSVRVNQLAQVFLLRP
jgi:hypothetical protein